MPGPFAGIAAGATALLGVALLRAAWAARGVRQRLLTGAGWLALACGLLLSMHAYGWDRGLVIGASATSLISLAFVGANVTIRRARASTFKPAPPDARYKEARLPLRASRFFLAGPVAAAAALVLAAAFCIHAPGLLIDRLAAAAFLLPLLWSAFMGWSVSEPRLARVAVVLPLLAALGLACLS